MKPARLSPVERGATRTTKLLTAVDLITAIFAVGVTITSPLLVDALARATLDLTGWALGVHHRLAATLLEGFI